MKNNDSISKYSLPERLKYMRRARNISQASLAKKAKLAQSTIAQIESGRKDPSINTLKLIAAALDIHIAVLFATEDVHVFDMKRLSNKYESIEALHPTIYIALDKVIRYAKKIGFIN